jgi:K+-sensing histidine kinase KdpD
MSEAARPDPDALLEQIKREEKEATRGRLKIFFGMSPGVGKTYAMLQAARQKQAEGCEVVAGIVETHGRRPKRCSKAFRSCRACKLITVAQHCPKWISMPS